MSNPTHDEQYDIHQGSRGISPPPEFDDVPSYSYDERPPMTNNFMNAHIARHGDAALSPLALRTPDQADLLPEYVIEGTSFDSTALQGRNRQRRDSAAQESMKSAEAMDAVRAMEERDAVEAIRTMEENPEEAMLKGLLTGRQELQSIPEGLQINPEILDMLIRAGVIVRPVLQSTFGGHGVKQKMVSPDVYRAQQERNDKKAKAYATLSDQVNGMRHDRDYTRTAFDATTKLLLLNPEYYTMWNYRRDILLHGIFPILSDVDKQTLLTEELKQLQLIMKDFPKVYWIWNHRKWVLSQCVWPDWSTELLLVSKMLERDARNFHVWEYRRYVVAQSEASGEGSKTKREFEYTTAAINANFSNFSAWHNRTKLIPKLIDDASRQQMLHDELELIKGAIYTDPDDQSVWLYHRWLCNPDSASAQLHPLAPTNTEDHIACLDTEMLMIDELLEEDPDLVWCTFAKVQYSLALHRLHNRPGNLLHTPAIQQLIHTLIAKDPLRAGRYRDWLIDSQLDEVISAVTRAGWKITAKSKDSIHAQIDNSTAVVITNG